MYAAESILLRVSIVLGMVAAVVTIIYLTPMPDTLFRSCDRPCNALDLPMRCRVKITLETHKSTNSIDCASTNSSDCDNSTAIGLISGFLSANDLLPGPSIQICQNDVLIIDVINKLPGHGVTLHWRGQPQAEAPFMDGVPMITQCPINSYTTFQYKFRASKAGTHLWHAHAGSEVADGFFGALIVRKPEKLDPQKRLYDIDNKKHLIIISEWTGTSITNFKIKKQSSKELLINGKHGNDPASFDIVRGKRYRFRVLFGGGISGCPVTLTIAEHLIKVINLDGTPINPYEVSSIDLAKGERVDFILNAKHSGVFFNIKVKTNCDSVNLEGAAILNYLGDETAVRKINTADVIGDELKNRMFTTAVCDSKLGHVCLGDVQAITKIPMKLKRDVDNVFYLPFNYKIMDIDEDRNKHYSINNISFTYPPSPLLTQFQDVPVDSLCNRDNMPARCEDLEICECVHVEEISLGSTVELIIIDQGGDAPENIFHLHGYNFYVVASKQFKKSMQLDELKQMDQEGLLFKRNLVSPVQKDTIRIPRYGVVALRFAANNPGFWMLRDGNANQWTRGLDMVFRVGLEDNLPDIPTSFPTCGSWVEPEFWL